MTKRLKKEIIKKMVYTNIEVNRMKKILVKNQVEGGQVAFDLLKESLAAGAQTLGLATGSSPIALYQEMVESDVDFSELYSVNLDEYVGLDVYKRQDQ